ELPRDMGDVVWTTTSTALDRAGRLHPDALAALSVTMRAGLLAEQAPHEPGTAAPPALRRSMRLSLVDAEAGLPDTGSEALAVEPYMLNSEASILSFSARVLALAEDLRTPLAERMRFLSIVADGLDEFFMVRVAGIKRSALEQTEERSADGLTPR